ncbi:hypothetical protein DICVIV_02040 [Dictyocaulus viviparus]|uniref:Uncharacterized protein n=1 Tax=Dictyocaulus viviparus TaxID=29172 RepID=A0A0D8Y6Z8_DICVI|nr:hypothetical protein DICVIV_02040 [Dictyocaulus viviparus]
MFLETTPKCCRPIYDNQAIDAFGFLRRHRRRFFMRFFLPYSVMKSISATEKTQSKHCCKAAKSLCSISESCGSENSTTL